MHEERSPAAIYSSIQLYAPPLVDIRAEYGYIFQKVSGHHDLIHMSESVPQVSCVIFDIDGTLTRTNELIFASFNHVADKYLGKILTRPEIIALFGPPEEGGLAKLLGEKEAVTAMDDLCSFYDDHHDEMASLHRGIEELLSFLKSQGVKLAIFTGKGKRTTEITLRALNIARYFDLIVSGTDVLHHKPHPEGIQKVIDEFKLDPSEVLMVGDALSDVKASRSAGVRIAAAVWDSYDRERLLQAGADYTFHDPIEVLAWFKEHQRIT
jgi:pyrophosphatase PpaX